MRNVILVLAAGAGLLAGAVSAEAMPVGSLVAADSAPALIRVAEGCGPGYHRNDFGRCRPEFRRRFERECFVRRTPFGERRVCR